MRIIFDHTLVFNKRECTDLFFLLSHYYRADIYTTSMKTSHIFYQVNFISDYSKNIQLGQKIELWANSNDIEKNDFIFISHIKNRNKIKDYLFNVIYFDNLKNIDKAFDIITKFIDNNLKLPVENK